MNASQNILDEMGNVTGPDTDRVDLLVRDAEGPATFVPSKESVLRVLLASCVRLLEKNPEFFMVYREGGNAPKFKHGTRVSAELEAARICRESGDDAYVLAVVAKHEGRKMPTNEEARKHADAFPCELTINGHRWVCGAWSPKTASRDLWPPRLGTTTRPFSPTGRRVSGRRLASGNRWRRTVTQSTETSQFEVNHGA